MSFFKKEVPEVLRLDPEAREKLAALEAERDRLASDLKAATAAVKAGEKREAKLAKERDAAIERAVAFEKAEQARFVDSLKAADAARAADVKREGEEEVKS